MTQTMSGAFDRVEEAIDFNAEKSAQNQKDLSQVKDELNGALPRVMAIIGQGANFDHSVSKAFIPKEWLIESEAIEIIGGGSY